VPPAPPDPVNDLVDTSGSAIDGRADDLPFAAASG
jgi:hypothetical protein